MRFECVVENLRNAVNVVEHITGKNITIPMLSSLLLEAEKGKITLSSTNLELGVKTWFRGSVREEGKVAISARTFSAFVSNLYSGDLIILESNGQDLVIENKSQRTLLKGYNVDDFPLFPEFQQERFLTIEKQKLLNILKRTIISVSSSIIKPEIASILFSIKSNTLLGVSTDSFRLSEEKTEKKYFTTKTNTFSFLLPRRTSEELIRILQNDTENEITMNIGANNITVSGENFILFSRLTEGSFPDYFAIVPNKFETTVVVNQKDLIERVKAGSIFAGKLSELVLTVDPHKKSLIFSAKSADVGEHTSYVNAMITGKELSLTLNWKYFLDGIMSLAADDIFLGFNSESSPVFIKPQKSDDSLYLIMPMRST